MNDTAEITAEVRREAYLQVLDSFTDQERWVLCTLKYFGETTALSIGRMLEGKMILTSIRRALSDLKKEGFVEPAGKKMESLGAKNTVFKITPAGTEYLYGRIQKKCA